MPLGLTRRSTSSIPEYLYIYIYLHASLYFSPSLSIHLNKLSFSSDLRVGLTRYCFVSGLLCTNRYYSSRTHPLFRHPTPPPSSPTLLRNTMFPPTLRYCNIYHTLLVMAISCAEGVRSCTPSTTGAAFAASGVWRA